MYELSEREAESEREDYPPFHVSSGIEEIDVSQEAKQLGNEAVVELLHGVPGARVELKDNEEMEQMFGEEGSEVYQAKKKRALETASLSQGETDHQTVVSSANGAKVLNDLKNLATEYKEKGNKSKTFIGDVAKALGAKRDGSASEYATFETKNGKIVTIRMANHNAKVSNFDNRGELEGISIVISAKPNQKMADDGQAHIEEFYYNELALRRAESQPLVDIIQSIEQALYSGKYVDKTGLAEHQEVNSNNDVEDTEQTDLMRKPNGVVYGAAKGRTIYLNREHLNANTGVHEYTHLWANAMMRKNPKGWSRIKDLLRGTPVWEEVLNDESYADIRGNEDAVASEVLSRLSGRNGAERLEQMAERLLAEADGVFEKASAHSLIERIRSAIEQFWNWVGKDLFGITDFSSIEEVQDRVLYDLVKGTDLGLSEVTEVDDIATGTLANSLEEDAVLEGRRQSDVGSIVDDVEKVLSDSEVEFDSIEIESELGSGSEADGSDLYRDGDAKDNLQDDSQHGKKSGSSLSSRTVSAMDGHVRGVAERLGLSNVDVVADGSGLEGRRRRAKGFFDKKTGRITIVLGNHSSVADVERTLLHEAVAHYGLRRLFGDRFDAFLDGVFENVDRSTREKIVALAGRHGWDFRAATEEYLASIAEDMNFERYDVGIWQRIKIWFAGMLNALGFDGYNSVDEISDADLRYILWSSYQNLKGENVGVFGEAADISMRNELGVDEHGEGDVLFRDGCVA